MNFDEWFKKYAAIRWRQLFRPQEDLGAAWNAALDAAIELPGTEEIRSELAQLKVKT